MTATHPSQPGYVPARFVAAGDNGAHKARLSLFEEKHTRFQQIEAGYLDGQHRASKP